MTAQELEDKVWSQDNVRIIVRCASDIKVKNYSQKNAAQANWSVTQFIEKRITSLLSGQEVIVLMGDGEQPHGRTLLALSVIPTSMDSNYERAHGVFAESFGFQRTAYVWR